MKAWSTQRLRDRVASVSMLALPDLRRLDRANPSTNFWWSQFLTALAWSTCTGFPLDNKEYYVEVLRESRRWFRRKRPALFKSDQWHFHHDNTPVHNSILVTDYLTKMGIKTVPQPPYSPDLAPCDFWLFPKLRVCRYETIEMKEAVTKVIDTLTQEDFHGPSKSCWNGITSALQPEEITPEGTRVCTINRSAHTKKVWKLI